MNRMVSIIIPVGGTINQDALELCLESILSQDYYPLEVILCEGYNDVPLFEKFEKPQVKYRKKKLSSSSQFSISEARNLGLFYSKGEYICMLDGDMAFSNKFCLRKIINVFEDSNGLTLILPMMKHISEKDANTWVNELKMGCDVFSFLSNCYLIDKYIYSTSIQSNTLKVVSHPYNKNKSERKYVIEDSDWNTFNKNPFIWIGLEPTIFTPSVHKGFLFTYKSSLLSVGGYCEKFSGWGGEDGDVKWKLKSLSNSLSLFKNTGIELVHVKHKKPYYSNVKYEKNKKISKDRKRTNVTNAILQDIFKTESYLAEIIRQKFN